MENLELKYCKIVNFRFSTLSSSGYGFLNCLALGVDLGCGNVHKSTPLIAVLIDIATDKNLHLGLGLNLGGFFDQSILTI